MKKSLSLVVVLLLFLLTSCSKTEVEEEIDYDELIIELYGEELVDPTEGGTLPQEDVAVYSHIFSSYALVYPNFDQMMYSQHSKFVYGKVIAERDNNVFTKSLFLEVYLTQFDDERKIIRISIMIDETYLSIGGLYVINLNYVEGYDYYSCSQYTDSVFWILSGYIGIPDIYYEDLKDLKEADKFIRYVFY